MAPAHLARPGVHSTLPPTCPAQRLPARPLLRLAQRRGPTKMGAYPRPVGLEATLPSPAPRATSTALLPLPDSHALGGHARTSSSLDRPHDHSPPPPIEWRRTTSAPQRPRPSAVWSPPEGRPRTQN